jgi:hypothetical protein
MSERDDSVYTLAKLQEKPARSTRDLAVLEAAKAKAAMNKQKLGTPVKKAESFWSYLSKPMWLGTGSLAAAALSVFIVFGHQVAPDEKVASAPDAAASTSVAPAAAPAPAPAPVVAPPPTSDVSSNREAARSAPVISVRRDAAAPKKELSVQQNKQIATASEPAVAAPSAPLAVAPAPTIAPVAVAPSLSIEAPAAAPSSRVQSSGAPSGRMAVATAPAPAVVADSVARKRESTSALVATDTCVLDIKAIPVERQTLAVEATKQLLIQCAQSVPKTQWPTDIDWAKKLLDQQQEKPQ